MCIIRPLALCDASAYLELLGESSQVKLQPKQFQQFMTMLKLRGAQVYVMVDDSNRVMATARLTLVPQVHPLKPTALISDMVVGTPFRNQGYGREVLDFLILCAKRAKAYRIDIAADEQDANFFINAAGFRPSFCAVLSFCPSKL